MKCICGGDTRVMDSRSNDKKPDYVSDVIENTVFRRRKCKKCDNTFSTIEMHICDISKHRDAYSKQMINNSLNAAINKLQEMIE